MVAITPTDYQKLLSVIPHYKHRLITKILNETGLPYEDLGALKQHPEWFTKEGIQFPTGLITLDPIAISRITLDFISKISVLPSEEEK